MAKASHSLQKGAVVQHTAKAHNLKGQLPEGSMESLATTIRFVTLNCRTLSSELQQAALSRLLRYLCVPFVVLQETRMRDRPVISIENYTIYCGDADENKVGGCVIAVRNDYKNLVEEFGSTSSRCPMCCENGTMQRSARRTTVTVWSTCANRRASSSLPRLRGIIDAISSRGRGPS
ncbi:hypothetical protein RB195_001492 [Necator americanus]|uniref:Uncharacterized protein n=1 Tax=Necator americanus TaxID=51031 RepID=A0ABR1DER4_NECAM